MGRHSGPPEPPPVPPRRDPAPSRSAPRGPQHRPLDRIVLAAAAAAGTGAVMVWAGAPTNAALFGTVGSAVVVLISAWLARTGPTPPDNPRTTDLGDREP